PADLCLHVEHFVETRTSDGSDHVAGIVLQTQCEKPGFGGKNVALIGPFAHESLTIVRNGVGTGVADPPHGTRQTGKNDDEVRHDLQPVLQTPEFSYVHGIDLVLFHIFVVHLSLDTSDMAMNSPPWTQLLFCTVSLRLLPVRS